MPPPVPLHRRWLNALLSDRGGVWFCAVATALLVFSAKLALIAQCGSDLPFWDQWDAEGASLYAPYLQGTLGWGELVAPHNEHRILFTRLLSLVLLEANGQWDALLQMVVNAALHAGVIALLAALFRRSLGGFAGTSAAVVLIALFSLPLAWENTLSGFQSQFYFLVLFSVAHVVGSTLGAPRAATTWLAQVAGVCALFSMASGLISAAVVLLVLGFRIVQRRALQPGETALIAVNLLLLAVGWWLKVDHPGHEALRATSLPTLLSALAELLKWPAPWLWALPLTLAPFLALVVLTWRQPTPLRFLLLALTLWWALQVLALALARGGGGAPTSPRYLDILLTGVAVAWVAWIDWWRHWRLAGPRRWAVAVGAVVWLGVMGAGLAAGFRDVRDGTWATFPALQARREAVVAQYVTTRSSTFFEREPWHDLPYPSAERLAKLLDLPVLRRILPPSVRAPLPLEVDANASRNVGRQRIPEHLPTLAAWGSYPAAHDETSLLVSRRLLSQAPALAFRVAGTRATIRLESALLGSGATVVRSPLNWERWVPEGDFRNFRIVAEAPAGEWFALTGPVELGRWRSTVEWLLQQRRALAIGGALLLIGSLGLTGWVRRAPERNQRA